MKSLLCEHFHFKVGTSGIYCSTQEIHTSQVKLVGLTMMKNLSFNFILCTALLYQICLHLEWSQELY